MKRINIEKIVILVLKQEVYFHLFIELFTAHTSEVASIYKVNWTYSDIFKAQDHKYVFLKLCLEFLEVTH